MVQPLGNLLPFTYTLTTQNMVANGSDTQKIIFGVDSTFLLTEFLAYTSQDDPSDQNTPSNFTVNILDTTTGRNLMNAPLQRALFAGKLANFAQGERTIIEIPVNEQWQFNFVNLTASPLQVFIGLKGYKKFGNLPFNF